jgi:hypothetical protein
MKERAAKTNEAFARSSCIYTSNLARALARVETPVIEVEMLYIIPIIYK